MSIEVIVDNRLKIKWKELPKAMYEEIKDALTYNNPTYFKNKATRRPTKGIPQKIFSYDVNKDILSLARGTSYKIKEIAKAHDVSLTFIDKRISIPHNFSTQIELRNYQQKPCDTLVRLQNSLMQGVCGCGKTVILLKAIEKIGQKTLVIVHEAKLQKQWVDSIKDFFGYTDDEVGIIGGISKGKDRIRPITVAMQQSLLRKAGQYGKEFGCVVGDEVHRFAASTFQEVIDQFHAKYRIGATATPKRKDGKHFLVFDQFGKISSEISDDDLLELDMTMDVKMVIVKTNYTYSGPMTQRRYKAITGHDPDTNEPKWETITEEEIHPNDLLMNMIMDADRNRLIYSFLKAEVDNGRYCILLADRRRFTANWQRWLANKDVEAKLLVGGQEHREEGEEAIRRIMGPGDLHVVIGTTVADEGLDIKRLDRGFSATPTATNERRIVQQVGRIKRKCEGKDNAIWYYFLDHKLKNYDKHEKLLKKYFRTVEVLETEHEISEYLYHLANK